MALTKNKGLSKSRSLFPRTSFLDDFFNADWPLLDWNNGITKEWMPAANIIEKDKEYTVELSVPGYENKDIHVEVEDNILHIQGEKKQESKEEKEDYTRQEFSYGSFSRSFQLPETVNEDKISAKCKNGVLNIALPKKDTAVLKKKTKEITIA